MPEVIEFIDAIARQKKRDVLYLKFTPAGSEGYEDDIFLDWDALPVRREAIAWLDEHHIEWSPCGNFANENMMCGYLGLIYLDVPFDVSNPVFQVLSNHFETANGEMKIEGVMFCYLPLEMAMESQHHDKPGFWDEWAQNF